MAEIKHPKVEKGHTKIRNVPIAVTPEGFWCCPSPVGFQKATKIQNPSNKTKSSSALPKHTIPKKQTSHNERRPPPPPPPTTTSLRASIASDDQTTCGTDLPPAVGNGSDRGPRPKVENPPRKVAIEFGEPGTSDLKVILLGKHGFSVKLSVHRNVLIQSSSFFADKLSQLASNLPCLEVDDCEDIEIHVETVGLMYCNEMKQRLIKQSLARVLRILKVAELLGFSSCIQSCLEYLEAVPWVGEEEEEKVVSTVLRLQNEGIGVSPILKRISSNDSAPPKDTLPHIVELVLKSNEERGRREMKSIVLKLLRESNNLPGPVDVCNQTLYSSCKSCMNSLLSFFKQAAEPMDNKEPLLKQVALEADNLLWLLEILADRQAADQFAALWTVQYELADHSTGKLWKKELGGQSSHFHWRSNRAFCLLGWGVS
ncbi:BTB/POZ domain-containing protein At3g50780 [Linum grandiflorum]